MSFCQYQTSYAGKCLRYIPYGDRCKRHKGLVEKPHKERAKRVRGDSRWQSEQGMFHGKTE